jgi:hypothetical protein
VQGSGHGKGGSHVGEGGSGVFGEEMGGNVSIGQIGEFRNLEIEK